MKYPMLIRFLSGLTFLIFLCPFFQMCSDEDMLKKHKEVEITEYELSANNDSNINPVQQDSKFEPVESIETSDESASTGYQLAVCPFADTNGSKLKLSDIEDPGLLALICYSVTLLLSVVVFIYAHKKKYKKIVLFGIVSLITILIPLGVFYNIDLLDDINQIKYGYYLFVINVISIILLANKGNSKVITHAI